MPGAGRAKRPPAKISGGRPYEEGWSLHVKLPILRPFDECLPCCGSHYQHRASGVLTVAYGDAVWEHGDLRAIRRVEETLRSYAETEGYCFAMLFHEFGGGADRAFYELVEELKRIDARDVVVLSLDHFSRHPILRDGMVTHLRLAAGAHVHEVTNHAPTPR